ncbi:Beta-lactamase enzyme family protein [Hymenobacter gelipurpurascens]|uniref:Beta-lactamase enzyme family protein n=1 Tax=Hymenobacter gelipurpurascens TaxID=89968 RepID=A0A212U8Y0_9BACT|nr:serine hydrolase [Hymenobacter gelipurpurascens]SNC74610.1 Beta-lactamase enzyme family protein [Hymenobacter gelipurpurascens]
MKCSLRVGLLLLVAAWITTESSSAQAQPGNPLRRLLRQDAALAPVLQQAAAHRVQILYTQIHRDAQGRPHFRSFRYRVRPHEYFYPASAIKLPTAVLALEKLRALSANIPDLTPEAPLRIDSAYARQTPVLHDSSSATGRASLAQYIRKMLLVSDNDAYNRLYEFVGPATLNAGLYRHGLRHTVLRHRLSVGDTDSTARHTNPVALYADTTLTRPLYVQPAAFFAGKWPRPVHKGVRIGEAHMQGSQRINEPLDFSTKNTTSLADLQQVLRAVLFPEAVPARQRFALAPSDTEFLRRYLSLLPRQSTFPHYDSTAYPDNYAKFLLAGGPAAPLPPGVRIYNKIGQAYGFLIDNAYIRNEALGVEFLLSAVVYTNSDGVLNDDQYEYDTVGFPFLRRVGEVVYAYEVQQQANRKAKKRQ